MNNPHADAQHFGFWVTHYADGVGNCSRLSGFRLNTWTFPYGVTVTVDYAATTALDNKIQNVSPGPYPSSSQPLGVHNDAGTTGRSLAYTFDVSGNLTGVKDGTRTVSFAGGLGGLPSMTDPMGILTGFAYDAPVATDATHRPVPYPQLATITTADNPTTPNIEYDYDGLGQVSLVKDAETLQVGDRNPYTFLIGDGTRGERDDPLGGAYAVTFDTYGHPSRYQDELGRVTLASIDSRSRPVSYIYPEGDCEAFAYDNQNNTLSYTRVDKTGACDPTNVSHRIQTLASWDATWNKPLSVTTPNGNTTSFTYNGSGNGISLLATATRPADADGNVGVYQFSYDAKGKPTEADVPFVGNSTTTTQWIKTGNSYDSANENLLTSTLDPTGVAAQTVYGYDAYGNVTSTTDPRGNVTVSQYDANRKKTFDYHHMGSATAPLDAVTQTQYDVIEREKEVDAVKCFDNATTCPQTGSSVVTWIAVRKTTYTPTSKVKTVTDADGKTATNDYDGNDRLQTVSDPVGRKIHNVYDAGGQKLVELRGWAGTNNNCAVTGTLQQCYVTYTYGNDGEMLTEMDANGALATPQYATTYAYDAFNRPTITTFPDGSTEQITGYDEDSNILARVNRAGQSFGFFYDALDQMTEKDVPAVGAIPAVTTLWHRYLNGTISDLTDSNGNDLYMLNGTATYYDTAGRLVRTDTTIPGIASALSTNYTLDASGNRIQLNWPDGYYVAYAYDPLNRMTTVKESGATTLATYSYNAMSRRTYLAYPHASTAYLYSAAGDLKSLTEAVASGSVPTYSFGYTDAHQLNSEASSDPTYLWQPTAAHTDSYSAANKLNQYTTINGGASGGHDCHGNAQQYTYDCNGNLTGDGTWSYTYDPENRLMTANKTAGGTVAASYAYDSQGRRTHRSGTGVTETYFLVDGQDDIAEYNSSGAVTWRYIPGHSINESVAAIPVSGTRRFYLRDRHGSTIAAVNNAGTQIEGPYTYDSWGTCFTSSGAACPTNAAPFRFVGMRYDPETGLYYARARMYSSALGRFMQVDPVGYTANLNLYSYSANDPINAFDPTGMTALVEVLSDTDIHITLPVVVQGGNGTQADVDRIVHNIQQVWTGKFGKYNVVTTVSVLDPNHLAGQQFANELVVTQGDTTGGKNVHSYNRESVVPDQNGSSIHISMADMNSQGAPGESAKADDTAGHEAGHSMGLPDEEGDMGGDIMDSTILNPNTGAGGRVTEDDITKIINSPRNVVVHPGQGKKSVPGSQKTGCQAHSSGGQPLTCGN